jgi:HEPN domain-containing protein
MCLKAVLLHAKALFPPTHSLQDLVARLVSCGVSPPNAVSLGTLTPYAVTLRYPGPGRPIPAAAVEEALGLAEATYAWASDLVLP